jgi:hypothetical protein
MAAPASQNCVATSQRRRSRMSASAPLGRPSRNTGRVDADCTSATQIGVLVSVVMLHAAATSFIHMQRFAVAQEPHSRRKTGTLKGSNASIERREVARLGAIGSSSGGMDDMAWRIGGGRGGGGDRVAAGCALPP